MCFIRMCNLLLKNSCLHSGKKKVLYVFFRTMPAGQGIFTGAIPGRFNSWNKQSAYPFTERWDEISLESDRGANGNEMYSGKDAYGKYIYS